MKEAPKQITVLDHLVSYGEHTVHGLKQLQRIFAQETSESKVMLEIYAKYLAQQASPAELQHANKQFRELLKTVGLGAIFMLPGGVLTLPLTIAAAKKLGIDIVPDSFKTLESTATAKKPEATRYDDQH